MTVLGVIWPYLSIWLTEISLKKSSKMEFRLIDLRSLGPPSQKLWTNQISAEFLVKYVILGGQNWALKDQPGQKRVTSPPKNHNKVHYNWKQCIFDEKWTIAVIGLHQHPMLTRCAGNMQIIFLTDFDIRFFSSSRWLDVDKISGLVSDWANRNWKKSPQKVVLMYGQNF